jgi:hypothetical protein
MFFLQKYRKVHHPRVLMKSRREKLESRFILDVTVLDGTLMTPSTPFTKIWRMHNNGSVVWPRGTQLVWVGGDQFALQTSVPLEVAIHIHCFYTYVCLLFRLQIRLHVVELEDILSCFFCCADSCGWFSCGQRD